MPLTLLVDPLKIRVPQKTRAAGESGSTSRTGQVGTAIRSETAHNSRSRLRLRTPTTSGKENQLLTKTGLDRDPLATLGATPRDDRATSFGLHARTKSVRLRS